MHHGLHTPPDVGEDNNSVSDLDEKDVEIWGHPSNMTLPSEGYRVVHQRTSLSLPTSSRIPAIRSDSFSKTKEHGTHTFKRRFIHLLQHAVKNWSSILLVFVPAGVLAPYFGWSDSVVFVFNCIAVIPLADKLCWATDCVSIYLGETAGALLNITMGNAAELILFHALLQRQYMIVRTSLLGSIIVNLLLVLGLAIITGELQLRGQTYSMIPTRVAAALLCLTTMSLLIPSTIHTSNKSNELVLNLSRGISIVLILVYMTYLWSQMRGSSKLTYAPIIQSDPGRSHAGETIGITEMVPRTYRRRTLSYPREPRLSIDPSTNTIAFDALPNYAPTDQNMKLGPVRPSLTTRISSSFQLAKATPWIQKTFPILVLIVGTALMSLCSGHLVDSIDHFVEHSPLSKTMVGLIILPFVGNAAELVSGIMFATRKQMDLAFAVSLGSAIQIALFVTPLMVVTGWALDREMALHFTVFEAVSLIASTALIGCLILDNRCNMLKGVSLFAGYTIIGLAAYFVPNLE